MSPLFGAHESSVAADLMHAQATAELDVPVKCLLFWAGSLLYLSWCGMNGLAFKSRIAKFVRKLCSSRCWPAIPYRGVRVTGDYFAPVQKLKRADSWKFRIVEKETAAGFLARRRSLRSLEGWTTVYAFTAALFTRRRSRPATPMRPAPSMAIEAGSGVGTVPKVWSMLLV